MAETTTEGGFFPPLPLSPPASIASHSVSTLPTPRQTPLRPGSTKESALVNHVDARLLEISGKNERRFDTGSNARLAQQNVPPLFRDGYHDFGELAKDLNSVIDLIWISGTPVLQIPYLLSISLSLIDYLQSFTLSPTSLFPLIHKIDVAFASLMVGQDVETKHVLPDGGLRRLSMTEKVRLRSIVESTRIAIITASRQESNQEDATTSDQTDVETTAYDTDTTMDDGPAHHRADNLPDWDMEAAKVYERSISELGLSLDTELS